MERIEHDLGFRLVHGDVVGDLGDPDVATLVALPDRADGDDVGVGIAGRLDLGDHLGIGVIARIVGREVGGSRRRGGGERGCARGDEERGQPDGQPRWAVVMRASCPPGDGRGYHAMVLRRTGTDRPRNTKGRRGVLGATDGSTRTRRTTGVSTMDRSIRRAGAALGAALLVIALTAAPAFACGGLIGPNGAVNLLRTTTLAGYHDGEEHYITAFQFAGGGGAFGSLTPLPGIPSSVEKGGDWTLQRLDPGDRAAAGLRRRRARERRGWFRRGTDEGPHRRARRDRPARRLGGGRHLGDRARLPPPARRPRGARLLRGALADLPGRRVRCRCGVCPWPGGR